MSKRERLIFGGVFIATLALAALVYAFTEEQLLNEWYDPTNHALKLTIVGS